MSGSPPRRNPRDAFTGRGLHTRPIFEKESEMNTQRIELDPPPVARFREQGLDLAASDLRITLRRAVAAAKGSDFEQALRTWDAIAAAIRAIQQASPCDRAF